MSKARNLSDFISDATIDSTEIADLSVTHAKLHTDMNLSSKTLTFAANQISGNSVDGGVISNFASTGIDDNASATAVTILSDGNVGIGTSSPGSNKLYVYQSNSALPSVNLSHVNGNRINVSASYNYYDAYNHIFRGLNGTDTHMTINNSGNVGIGTSSGANLLNIHQADASSNSYLHITHADGGSAATDGLSIGLESDGVNAVIRNRENGYLRMYTNNTERMRISSSGNLMLDPNSVGNKYARFGTSSTGDGHILLDRGGAHKWQITSGTTNALQFYNYTASLESMRIDSSGNVGINESNPSHRLHINGGSNDEARVRVTNTANGQASLDLDNGEGYFRTYTDAGEYRIYDQTDGTHRLVIDTSGKVGIGTMGPNALLEVRNSTTATDSIIASAGLVTAGHYHDLIVGDGPNYAVGLRRYITQSNPSWLRPRLDFIVQNANTYLPADRQVRMSISDTGTVSVPGSLSKGSGSFKIDHPLPSKTETHNLVHSFVESPQANNIYRGKVVLVDGSATINIDTVSGMTDGTYVLLNTNTQCFTSNETGWTAVKGSVSGNILTITSQVSCTDTISWMVIGERHDQHMIDTDWTNEDGKVIVEPLKENEPE